MDRNEIVLLLYGLVMCMLTGQMEASGNIGNRGYSIWYETHFLIEKKGICKLIYFKPKHFDRYTLYEVVGFFASYLSIPVFAGLGLLCYADVIQEGFLTVLAGVISMVGLLAEREPNRIARRRCIFASFAKAHLARLVSCFGSL